MEQYRYTNFLVIEGIEYKRGKMLFDVYVYDQEIDEFVHIIHDGEYSPGATRGTKSEAMTLLAKMGFIPKEFDDQYAFYTLGLPFKIVDYEAPRFY